MSVRLLYGDDGRGNLVYVSQAQRGRACGLVCPACATPLLAKKGAVRVPHLAHDAADRRCVGAVETVTHRLAKEVLRERRELLLPSFVLRAPRPRGRIGDWEALSATTRQFKGVAVEPPLTGVRPDALVMWERGQIAVEFFVAHATTSDKLARLRTLGLATVEIDLRKWVRWDVDKAVLAQAVVSDAPREWLTVPALFASEMAASYQAWWELWERREQGWELETDLTTVTARRPRLSALEEVQRGFAQLRAAHGIAEPKAPPSDGVHFDEPALRRWLCDDIVKRRPLGPRG